MKGERTRQQVLELAAGLFNRGGYRATSISDVMEATGLKKGGIYRHFESKEELSLEAFDFAVARMSARFAAALKPEETAEGKLRAIVQVYAELPENPPVPGGCPLLNAAVEADDAHPALRQRVAEVVDGLLKAIAKIVRDGQRSGEFRKSASPSSVARVLVASLEGAVMLAKLQGKPHSMKTVVTYLDDFISGLA